VRHGLNVGRVAVVDFTIIAGHGLSRHKALPMWGPKRIFGDVAVTLDQR